MLSRRGTGGASLWACPPLRLFRRHLGESEVEIVWVGPYGYRTQLMECFRQGRVFFAGDVAHVMNPFGARGGNSGVQDAENIAWKLAAVETGRAGAALLDSYDAERRAAAAHNIDVTSRTIRFLAPSAPRMRLARPEQSTTDSASSV